MRKKRLRSSKHSDLSIHHLSIQHYPSFVRPSSPVGHFDSCTALFHLSRQRRYLSTHFLGLVRLARPVHAAPAVQQVEARHCPSSRLHEATSGRGEKAPPRADAISISAARKSRSSSPIVDRRGREEGGEGATAVVQTTAVLVTFSSTPKSPVAHKSRSRSRGAPK